MRKKISWSICILVLHPCASSVCFMKGAASLPTTEVAVLVLHQSDNRTWHFGLRRIWGRESQFRLQSTVSQRCEVRRLAPVAVALSETLTLIQSPCDYQHATPSQLSTASKKTCSSLWAWIALFLLLCFVDTWRWQHPSLEAVAQSEPKQRRTGCQGGPRGVGPRSKPSESAQLV